MKSSRFFVMYLVASDKKASTICTITHCACMTKGNLLSRFSQLLCVEKRMEKASLSLSLTFCYSQSPDAVSKFHFIDMSRSTASIQMRFCATCYYQHLIGIKLLSHKVLPLSPSDTKSTSEKKNTLGRSK